MSRVKIPRIVIGGLSSGVGKTTVMVALTMAFRKRGLRVNTFKCGPDYLDPTYHQRSSEQSCHNLDGWIMGKDAVQQTFHRAAHDCDIALIEGVMGLYDGASPKGEAGSTAEISKWLDAPVLVCIDASGMARTIAALEHGLVNFDPKVKVAGLISNFVGSKRHKDLLGEALKTLPLIGGFTKQPSEFHFPDRHLGLSTAREDLVPQSLFDHWAELAESSFDLDAILKLAQSAGDFPKPEIQQDNPKKSCRIAYAYDEAFHFYYEDNLARLRSLGAELVPFSPVNDQELPEADGLYFGGGYPELWAEKLSQNKAMNAAIKKFATSKRPIYGECGGLIYLCDGVTTGDGQRYSMLGLLPGEVTMKDKLQALGYVEVELQDKCFLGEAGTRFRGHQFRYSGIELTSPVQETYRIRKRRNNAISMEGYQDQNVMGSYVHAHWASNPKVCENFISACEAHAHDS